MKNTLGQIHSIFFTEEKFFFIAKDLCLLHFSGNSVQICIIRPCYAHIFHGYSEAVLSSSLPLEWFCFCFFFLKCESWLDDSLGHYLHLFYSNWTATIFVAVSEVVSCFELSTHTVVLILVITQTRLWPIKLL